MIDSVYNPVPVAVNLPSVATKSLVGEISGLPFTERGSFRLLSTSGELISAVGGVLPLSLQGPAGSTAYATAFSGDKADAVYAAGDDVLNFSFGQGGVAPSGDPAEVNGIATVRQANGEVVPAARDLVAVQVDGSDWRVVGSARSAEADGGYTISGLVDPGANVYLMALDDFGVRFEASGEVVVGDLIHPTTPNGYVYRVITAGTLPATEPDWWTTGQQQVGTATLEAREYLRPLAHGPVDVTFL